MYGTKKREKSDTARNEIEFLKKEEGKVESMKDQMIMFARFPLKGPERRYTTLIYTLSGDLLTDEEVKS